ncbi:MAG: hypothetical protein ACC634_05745 [Hyphomicrobiales bacterium]
MAKIAVIVEPDRDVGMGFASDLAHLGMDSVIVGNLKQALVCIATMPADVVLVSGDVADGGAVKRLVRATRPGTAVILVAGAVDFDLIGAAIWQGAAECLVRPFGADLLEFKLQQTGVLDKVQQLESHAAG